MLGAGGLRVLAGPVTPGVTERVPSFRINSLFLSVRVEEHTDLTNVRNRDVLSPSLLPSSLLSLSPQPPTTPL